MKLLLKLLNKRIVFKSIRKVNLLIFGYDKFEFNKKISHFYYNHDEVNLRYFFQFIFIFLKNLFSNNKLSIYDAYLHTIIKYCNCKIVLGHDREQGIFKVKKFFPNKITITYQFGYWFTVLMKLGHDVVRNKEVDHYFMFDERTKKMTEDIVKSNYYIAGSVANNEKILPFKKKKYDFMFISNFRANSLGSDNFMKCSAFMLSKLSEYCNTNNKTFCIARVSAREDKKKYSFSIKKDEEKFLKANAKNYFLEDIDSFKLANLSKVSVCTHSNLGYQLLARGNKVLFLNTENDIYKWHFISENIGPFWYKGKNSNEIFKQLQNLLNMKEDEWNKILSNSSVPIKFDTGNKLLKNLISKIILGSSKSEVNH